MRRERWWRTESYPLWRAAGLSGRVLASAPRFAPRPGNSPLPQWEAFTKPLRNLILPWRLESLRDRHSAPTT